MRGRTGTVGGLAGTFVLLCAAGVTPAQTPAPAGAPPGADQPAAIVNGETITRGELAAAVRQVGPTPTPMTEAQKRQHLQMVLGALIDKALLRQYLKQNGPPVDPREVNQKLAEWVDGLRQQKKSLQEFCHEMNLTEADVREAISMNLQWRTYAQKNVTDQDLENYYKEFKDFFDDVEVQVSQIFLHVPPGGSDSDKARVRKTLTDLRAKLVANQVDFAQAAKEVSQDPNAPEGGDLGLIKRKWFIDESLARAAFSLPVGQVSDIVETEYGMHLLKVTKRTPGHPSDFAREKEKVRDVYMEDVVQNVLVQQRKAAKIDIRLP